MNGLGSWQTWARTVGPFGGLERLLLLEIARLADGRGTAFVPISHLVAVGGKSRATTFRALQKLEAYGVLTRSKRRNQRGKQASSQFQLRRHVAVAPTDSRNLPGSAVAGYSPASPALTADLGCVSVADVEPISPLDNDGLRTAITGALTAGWDSVEGRRLAVTVHSVGKLQFWSAAQRQQVACDVAMSDAVDYVLAYAWDMLVAHGEKIATAIRPWAKWTTLVGFAPLMRDVTTVQVCDPATLPQPGPDYSLSPSVEVGYEDFVGPLGTITTALIQAGMDETTAYAGTLRVAEIAAQYPRSLRHTIAGRDVRLSELGVSGPQARAWMTLLTGTRRDSLRSVLDLSDNEITAVAREIAGASADLATLTA